MESQPEVSLNQKLEQSSDEITRDGYTNHVPSDIHDPEHRAARVDALPFPSWQVPYLNALRELDPEELGGCIFAAVVAILVRASQITILQDASHEQQAMSDALDALAALSGSKKQSSKLPKGVNQRAALTVLSRTEAYPQESVKEYLARIVDQIPTGEGLQEAGQQQEGRKEARA